jgi:hypothetical protein
MIEFGENYLQKKLCLHQAEAQEILMGYPREHRLSAKEF